MIHVVMISLQQIKELREKTRAGVSDVKRALEESGGDMDKAILAIERRLGNNAGKRAGRETHSGVVDAYIHSNARIGSMVELLCETDFVARSPAFKELAHDLAMHVAAMNPTYLSFESIPEDIRRVEKDRFEEEVAKMAKSEALGAEIVEGKLKGYFGAVTLMDQVFVKEQKKTVAAVMNEAIGRFGENIRVAKFVRLEL